MLQVVSHTMHVIHVYSEYGSDGRTFSNFGPPFPGQPQPPSLSILYKVIISHVAAAPGPLACPSPGARPPSLS